MSIVTNERQAAPAWRLSSPRTHELAQHTSTVIDVVRSLAMVAIPALLLLITGVVAGLSPGVSKVDRGVSVGGVAIGGLSRAQATTTLNASFQKFLDTPLTFTLDSQTAHATPRELGVTFDTNATMAQAMNVGRGGVFSAAAERFIAHTVGTDITPVYTYDSSKLVRVLQGLGGSQLVRPTNAIFVTNGDRLDIRASASGTGIDANAAVQQLQHRIASLSSTAITVSVIDVAPSVSTADLQAIGAQAVDFLQTPMTITDGQHYWELPTSALSRMLSARDGKLTVNVAAVSPLLDALSSSVNRDATDAVIKMRSDGMFYVVPETKSRTLDVEASVKQFQSAVVGGKHDVTLVTTEAAPKTTAASLQPLLDKANAIMTAGMTVTWADGQQALDKVALAGTLTFDPQTNTLKFNRDALFSVLEPIARSINRPATGYRWKDGTVVAPAGALPGRVVDINASVNAVTENALKGQATTPLVVNNQEDPASGANGIVIRERLASASTYYGSSSANRATNVELATASLDGALIQPGGTFSFNNAIGGTATLDDGYQVGFGIVAGADGQPHTVPSVAGGICQVATTTFQAAFWSGVPIGTRNWHLYWIPNYGSGPGGMTGLDATVDPDSGLDFTFYNPTDQWLAIRAVADGEWVTVEIWGTSQGWTVHSDDPQITNVVKADTTMVYQKNDQLAPGEQIYVEHAEDGFTANIHRTVTDRNGNVIDDTTFTSYYQPSRNVTLVGPNTPVAPDTGSSDADVSSDSSEETDTSESVTETPTETSSEDTSTATPDATE